MGEDYGEEADPDEDADGTHRRRKKRPTAPSSGEATPADGAQTPAEEAQPQEATGGEEYYAETEPVYGDDERRMKKKEVEADPYEHSDKYEADDPYDDAADAAQTPMDEDDEDEEEMIRRLAWIKYYVKEGDTDKALELGWDGDMSFITNADDGAAAAPAAAPAAAGGALTVDPQKTMCRI